MKTKHFSIVRVKPALPHQVIFTRIKVLQEHLYVLRLHTKSQFDCVTEEGSRRGVRPGSEVLSPGLCEGTQAEGQGSWKKR